MPRLRSLSRTESDHPVVKEVYDRFFGDKDPAVDPGVLPERGGNPGTYWSVTALAPEILEWCEHGFGITLMPNGTYPKGPAIRLDAQLRELAIVRAGWAAGSQFVFSQHCKPLRATGIGEEKINAVPAWQTAECFTPIERAVLAYTDGIVYDRGRIADGVVDALKTFLPDEEILELTYCAAIYHMYSCVNKALRVDWDDRPDPVVEVPWPEGVDIPFPEYKPNRHGHD